VANGLIQSCIIPPPLHPLPPGEGKIKNFLLPGEGKRGDG
jgi:hypothetical protein